ncbi:MAG: hypothetical protein ACO3O0_02325 [Bacteroidia bacterium]
MRALKVKISGNHPNVILSPSLLHKSGMRLKYVSIYNPYIIQIHGYKTSVI